MVLLGLPTTLYGTLVKQKMAELNSLPAMGKWSPRYMSQGVRKPADGIYILLSSRMPAA